ncbi:replication protein [Azotobacter beijerinckii]|uniref:replication protein n=1 Tax=Azotobacter beijerinckii TaxID=170623 RepID=UPI00295526EF|nr:replication protein [Azotobacter beijerinckii]MDV7209935.1 replication protein [Azotobacter beijerinckii]
MTNIVTLRNTGGFTRMDNSLMEALATVDLPAREFRILMAIARHTIGYQLESKRLSADEIGKLTNMRRDVVSKAISHLLERRVIFRVGGSRGEIGISPVAEWAFFGGKRHCLSETKTSHSAQIVSLRNDASETETATSLLYSKKEPLVTLPSEEVTAPPADQAEVSEQEPKPARKKPFGLPQMLADNPNAIAEQLLTDWIALRKQKRATITPTVWKALNAELVKCAEAGIDAETAMTEALVAGWQGFKVDWLVNRLEKAGRMPRTSAGPNFDDTSWADDLGDL